MQIEWKSKFWGQYLTKKRREKAHIWGPFPPKRLYINYFELIDKILRKGGMIAFDNMLSHKEKVQDTLEAVTKHPHYQSEMIYTEAGMLLAVKVR